MLGQWAGAALLLYFGLRTLKDAWEKTEEAADDELADAEEEGAELGSRMAGQAGACGRLGLRPAVAALLWLEGVAGAPAAVLISFWARLAVHP